MKRPSLSEAQVAARVVTWLEAAGYRVYQEVTPGAAWTDNRADIVATRGSELVVVEAKRTLSFDVLAQAERWLGFATSVYVAVAYAKDSRGRELGWRVAGLLGLGAIEVTSLWPVEEGRVNPITVQWEPRVDATFNPRFRDVLCEEHATHAQAGTNRGGHFTRFKQTVAALRTFAEAHPGELLRVALSQSDHHYASIGSAINALSSTKRKMPEALAKLGIRIEHHPTSGAPTILPVEPISGGAS